MAKFYTKARCIISSVIGILLSTIIAGMYYSDQIDTANTEEEIIRVEKHVADLFNTLREGSLTWNDLITLEKILIDRATPVRLVICQTTTEKLPWLGSKLRQRNIPMTLIPLNKALRNIK